MVYKGQLTATDAGLDCGVRAERKVVEQEHAKLARLAEQLAVSRFTVNGETIVTKRQPVITMGRATVPLPLASFLQATAKGDARFRISRDEIDNGLTLFVRHDRLRAPNKFRKLDDGLKRAHVIVLYANGA